MCIPVLFLISCCSGEVSLVSVLSTAVSLSNPVVIKLFTSVNIPVCLSQAQMLHPPPVQTFLFRRGSLSESCLKGGGAKKLVSDRMKRGAESCKATLIEYVKT